jgi:hypothetical protein
MFHGQHPQTKLLHSAIVGMILNAVYLSSSAMARFVLLQVPSPEQSSLGTNFTSEICTQAVNDEPTTAARPASIRLPSFAIVYRIHL